MPLTATITWALTSFTLGMRSTGWSRTAWFVLGYCCILAGVMLKGPIAGVLVAVVIVPWALVDWWHKKTRLGGSLALPVQHASNWPAFWWSTCWGVPFLIVTILAWCWWMNDFTGGKFVDEFIIKHNLHRGLGGDDQLDGHAHPWWFYLYRVWIDTAPWGWLLPLAIYTGWQTKSVTPLARLGLAWFFSMLLVLSCLQYKRADYLLPAYPGLALFLAISVHAWWLKLKESSAIRLQRVAWATLALLALGWFSYVQWILPVWEPQRAMKPFAGVVREYLPAPGQVILFRIDSHQLAWELGKKVERIWEWENLQWWATRPAPIFVIMPAQYAHECSAQLKEGELIPLRHNTDISKGKHDVPLVLLVNTHGRSLAKR